MDHTAFNLTKERWPETDVLPLSHTDQPVALNILETEQFVQSCLRCEYVCKLLTQFLNDLIANWKLGRDKTKLCPHCIWRLDKTAKN